MTDGPVKAKGLMKGAGGVLGSGAFGFGMDFVSNVAAGDNIGTSAAKAGVSGVLFAANPLLFMTATSVPAIKDGFMAYNGWKREQTQWWNKAYGYDNRVGGNFVDSQRAQTMRQAAIQSIQGSKMNARSALGSEARILNPYSSRRY